MLYEQNASKAQLRVNEITAWTLEDKQLLLLYEASALTDEEKEIYTRLQDELTTYRGHTGGDGQAAGRK